ncbi:MAG TPA: FAD-dependent oxidoreductase [Microlunatus sp.]|nr:FAD-dependent oxidoreductase [Microlunatus sp.]
MVTEVLVLGGGYTAVWAARRLRRETAAARGAQVRITLVSTSRTHAFHGWTAEVLTGHVRLERTLTRLTDLLPGVRVICGTVDEVDLARREVVVVGSGRVDRLPYDHLVLGVGSRDATERVPGLHANGHSTKGDGALESLVGHLDAMVAQAVVTPDPIERARLLTVAVAGGGFAGVETAVAIQQRLDTLVRGRRGIVGIRPRVVLVHAGPDLLPGLRPQFDRVADHAAAQVALAGVEVWCGERLTAVTSTTARVAGRPALPVGTVVTTLGQVPVALPGTESLERDDTGRLAVDRFLRVQDGSGVVEGVWAGGDVAAVPHPSGAGSCPASALWAMYHGDRAGANIARALRGDPPRPFRFPGLGQAAGFGVGVGSAELAGVPLLGWSAWLARWMLFHYYMPSRAVALRTALEWFRPACRTPLEARRARRPSQTPIEDESAAA